MTLGNVRLSGDLEALLVPATEVRQFPGNPRNGDIEMIAESMMMNGVYRPLYAQKSTGFILAGNHTYQALLSMGADEVPVIWLDVDDATARRIVLVDNKAGQEGGYDDGMLISLLHKVQANDDLMGTGWTDGEVEQLEALERLNDVPLTDDVNAENAWPMLKFRVSPAARDAFWALSPEGDDSARFVSLLRRCGWEG